MKYVINIKQSVVAVAEPTDILSTAHQHIETINTHTQRKTLLLIYKVILTVDIPFNFISTL